MVSYCAHILGICSVYLLSTVFTFRLSSLLSVSFALHSLSRSQLTGGPVDVSCHTDHILKILVSCDYFRQILSNLIFRLTAHFPATSYTVPG